jgi:hypothetical protein
MPHSYSSFLLDTYVYTYEAVSEAARVFADCCEVDITLLGHTMRVNISTPPGSILRIEDEFLNYALGLSIEQTLRQV